MRSESFPSFPVLFNKCFFWSVLKYDYREETHTKEDERIESDDNTLEFQSETKRHQIKFDIYN